MQRLFNKVPETSSEAATNRPETIRSGNSAKTISPLHQLHHTIGNQAVQRLFKAHLLQSKLKVGASNDKYEQEADRVATQVMSMPAAQIQTQQTEEDEEPSVQRKPLSESNVPIVQRFCPECEKEVKRQEEDNDEELQTEPLIQRQSITTKTDEAEEQLVQTKRVSTQATDLEAETSRQIESLQNGGEELSTGEREFFEPRFNRDFSQVRIHHTAQAQQAANAIQAKAFTLSNHIVFNQGEYNPGSQASKQLLAHELTHVVQQGGAAATPVPQRKKQENRLTNQSHGLSSPRISSAPRAAQRLGDLSKIPPGLRCPTPPAQVPGETEHVTFANADTSLTPLQLRLLENFINNWRAAGANAMVRIDGYASTPGRDELNWRLSCERAQAVANVLNDPSRHIHSSSIDGIPNQFIDIFMQGETSEFGAMANNRRVGIFMDAPTPPTPPGPCTTPTAVPGSPTPTLIGSRGGCGAGADFTSHDFPGVPLALQVRSLYPSMHHLPDGALETSMHGELGAFAGIMGTTMATHFDGGSGAPLPHGLGSALSTAVAAAPTFTSLAAAIQTEIDNQVGVQIASRCHIDWTTFSLLPPRLPAANFNVISGDPLQLQAVLGGTQGLRVLIKDFNLNVTTNTYSAKIIVEICDDFGVDHTDMDPLNIGHGSPGLVAFWILQHERPPGHRAFVNTVTVETPITGSI